MQIGLAPLGAQETPGLVSQADSDQQLLGLWLGRFQSPRTRDLYARAYDRLAEYTGGKSIRATTAQDFASFATTLTHLAPATQAQVLASLKSLFSFAARLGYVTFNVGLVVTLPKVRRRLAERILPAEAILRMIGMEIDPRNRCLLRFAYASGGRVSEVVAVLWRDCIQTPEGGQVTLYGKGGKERTMPLSPATWAELDALRGQACPDDAVFASRKGGGCLTRQQAWCIVKAAAIRAGVVEPVSPHWFRHAHASHSLDRGAPIAEVRDTLGHASLTTTSGYIHARPKSGSSLYLGV